MRASDITWLSMILGSFIIIIPIIIFQYFKTGLVKDSIISFVRMSLQLTLVGIYLKYIFEFNSLALNLGWVALMIIAAAMSVIKRSQMRMSSFLIPIISSILINVVFNGLVFGLILVGMNNLFDPHYLIPIMGMVIGNTLNSSIVGIRTFYNGLRKDEEKYKYNLICGASTSEALAEFIRNSFREAFNPMIASNAAIGLIWLPGMMTGQILGGSSPLIAIKYQIMIVLSIFVGSVLTVFFSILFSRKFAFNSFDLLDNSLFQKNN